MRKGHLVMILSISVLKSREHRQLVMHSVLYQLRYQRVIGQPTTERATVVDLGLGVAFVR